MSIIVPAYNEEKSIAGTLKALTKLEYPKEQLEIIVVDDGSKDKTSEIARRFKGVKVIKKKNNCGKGSAMNIGLENAKGEIIACVDSDSFPKSNCLLKSVPFFADGSVASVTSAILVRKPKNLLERLQWIEYVMIVWSRKLLESLDSIYVTPGALGLYRKKALVKVGGFDEKNMTEDIEIAWRLLMNGFKIKMAPDSVSLTKVPENLKKWWHQRIRWNIGGVQTMLKYKYCFFRGKFKSLGNFVLPFFSISYVISLLGLSLLMFIIGKSSYDSLSYSSMVSSLGVNPLSHFEIYYLPDLFTYFGLVIFILSIVWVKISLNVTKERPNRSRSKNFMDLLLYLTIYVTIFPINLVQSMWKYARKEQKW